MANLYINVIQSSSKGNCIVLNDSKTNLILDFGVDISTWNRATHKFNILNSTIAGVLLTHSHIDHIQTIRDFKNAISLKYYCSEFTKSFINKKYNKEINCITLNNSINKWIKIENSNWKIKTFYTIHNCPESLCFLIKNNKTQIVYITDTKYFVNKNLKNKDVYIIESPFGIEYDIDNKIKISKIDSDKNHLNLEEAEKLFNTYKGRKTKYLIFSHLNPNIEDFSIIEKTVSYYKQKCINAFYIKPNELNKTKITIK